MGEYGILTHTANTTAETHKLNLAAASLFISSGGSINVDSKGYKNTEGPGAGIDHVDGGG